MILTDNTLQRLGIFRLLQDPSVVCIKGCVGCTRSALAVVRVLVQLHCIRH